MSASTRQVKSYRLPIVAIVLIILLLAGCDNPNRVTGVATPTLIPIRDRAAAGAAEAHSPEASATEAASETGSADEGDADVAAGEAMTATETIAETTAEATAAVEEVEPRIFFAQPTDHATLPISSTMIMGFTGLEVKPAGEVMEGTGHFHLLIDSDFIPAGTAIPNDAQHLHFGDGSTILELGLEPGPHTLRLQFADGAHIALEGDRYRDEIEVTVEEDAPEQAVYFVRPRDGDETETPVEITMGATGLIVEPAGEVRDGAGHLHILIDTDFIAVGEAVPKDETHRHFGDGQTEASLDLAPGGHTLRLQFTDGAHIVLEGEQYRDEIQIAVTEP